MRKVTEIQWQPDHDSQTLTMLITHYSLFISHYSLLIAHCSLLIAHCSLLIAHCSLPIAALPIAHCSLLIAHCSLLIAHCSFLIAQYSLLIGKKTWQKNELACWGPNTILWWQEQTLSRLTHSNVYENITEQTLYCWLFHIQAMSVRTESKLGRSGLLKN